MVDPSHPLDIRPGDEEAVDEVETWFLEYQAARDPAIRERIILAHLGLADRLAARFRGGHGLACEDLVQAARVGLVAAVDRYDPHRPNPFIAYAIACINGELRRCLRDTSWRLHVTRTLKELAMRVVKARDALTASLDRSPTLDEIGEYLGVDAELVAEALEAIDTRRHLSLDQPIDRAGGASFGSLLPAPASEIELEDRLSLPDLLDGLDELERQAVVLRFFQDLKQKQIGSELGYSQMHISRTLRRALRQMHEQLMS
ncbi:MAG TPA: sigma-70 family RNA polymerase sigma factor [Actinomycetes bacterium]|nr:sigma-70 family RNA polymerase sigma factor [Actinomycetes bacterium]